MSDKETDAQAQAEPPLSIGKRRAAALTPEARAAIDAGRDATRRAQIAALPWTEIRRGWLQGLSADDLAEKYGTKAGTIRARASREDWTGAARKLAITRARKQGKYAGDADPSPAIPIGVVLGPSMPEPPKVDPLIPGVTETPEGGSGNQGDKESGTPLPGDPGDKESGIQGENLQSASDSRPPPEKVAALFAELVDPYVARLAYMLLDGAVIAKPRTVTELATLQTIAHKAARGWKRDEAAGPMGVGKCARLPRVLDAEVIRE